MRVFSTLFFSLTFLFIGFYGGPEVAKFAAPLLLVAGIAASLKNHKAPEEPAKPKNVVNLGDFK